MGTVVSGEHKEKQIGILKEMNQLLESPITPGALLVIGKLLEANDRLLVTLEGIPEFEKAYARMSDLLKDMVFETGDFDDNLQKVQRLANGLDPLLHQFLETGKAPGLDDHMEEVGWQEEPQPDSVSNNGLELLDDGLVIQTLSDDLADPSLASDFISETEDGLESAETQLMTLEEDPSQINTLIHPIFRTMHTLKGNAAAFELTTIKTLAHHMEDLLGQIRDGSSVFSPEIFEIFFQGIDTLRRLIEQLRHLIEGRAVEPVDVRDTHELLAQGMVFTDGASRQPNKSKPEKRQPVQETPYQEPVEVKAPAPNEPAPKNPDATSTSPQKKGRLTEMIKVPAHKLDELGELIGEMVVALSVLNQSPIIEAMEDRQARERLDQLEKVTECLRERILGIRMFPVGAIFTKLTRQVRDLSRVCGKSLNFLVEGEETLVDKSIIDSIHAPLMHLVRNAIDHGLESPQERLAAGKPEVGTIRLTATHHGDSIVMEIKDDGKGLNSEAILNKALSRKLIKPGENLSEQQVYRLLFQPGFSTAQQVTELSGRGVGLDVVKKSIEQLRGRVSIQSTPGQGSVFSLKLPLTTSIIEGLVVRIGTSLFVIPILDVLSTVQPKPHELKTVHGQDGQFFLYAGEVTPILKLYETLQVETSVTDPAKAMLIIVSENNQKYGLMVDELLNRQQVVIKKLNPRFCAVEGISGGTILGNGRVGLILEPQRLLHQDR